MSNQPPFELGIFVADGDPDGLRLVTRSNWNGKGWFSTRSVGVSLARRFNAGETTRLIVRVA